MRNLLIEKGMQQVVAFPNFKLPCIECCDWNYINAVEEVVSDMEQFSDDMDDISSLILAEATPLPWDSTGRISLPEDFADHADIHGSATFVGKGKTFQIWNPEVYKAHKAEQLKRARERGLTLRFKTRKQEET